MILLDTHVLVWAQADSKRLSKPASQAIRRGRSGQGLAVSAISLWELALLMRRGRIRSNGTVEASIRDLTKGVVVLPISLDIAVLATQFPDDYPHDPADRLIGATARAERVILVTRDENIRRSPLLQTVW